jgi:hypothetical protein
MLLLPPGPALAQTVRGTLTQADTGRPIRGAAVTLEDPASVQRAGAITDSNGGFLLQAPSPGRYRLRARAPGYSEVLSRLLPVEAGAVVERPLTASPQVVQLKGLVVTGEGDRCVHRPENGEATERLWEQARKTLSTVALTEEVGLVTFRVLDYRKEIDPGGTVLAADSAVKVVTGTSPYRSIPVDSLMRYGFVREERDSVAYFAPDAEVLLSDAFLEGHCYSVRSGDAEHPERIGLGFEPVRARRKMQEVKGVLWLDRETGALRSLEYEYTRPPVRPRHGAPFGGGLSFDRVGDAWVVRRWSIRMPEVGNWRVASGLTARGLLRVRERGGEVLGVVGPDAAPTAESSGARVAGTLVLPGGAPIAGATVYLSGTQYSAVTDSLGRFRLEAPAGRYELGAFHRELAPGLPLVDSLSLTLVAGRDTTLHLVARGSPRSVPGGRSREDRS